MTDNLSDTDYFLKKRASKEQVRKLLNQILKKGGDVRFTEYCEKRMKERGITAPTVINTLERGIVQDAEEYAFESEVHWRYRVETTRYRVVITFEVENEVIVINAIDFKPHLTGKVLPLERRK